MKTVSKFRKIGGSAAVHIPAAVMKDWGVDPEAELDMFVEAGALLVKVAEPVVSLDSMIAECDLSAKPPKEDKAWDRMRPVGREVI
jgi:antitoxin component of MazEF toxin-antitoxin module